MAIPFRALVWRRLSSKARIATLKAVRRWTAYRQKREQIHVIGVLRKGLNIPAKKLREHFERLEMDGVPKSKLFETVIQDLQRLKMVADQLGMEKKNYDVVKGLLLGSRTLKGMTIKELIEMLEMRTKQQG